MDNTPLKVGTQVVYIPSHVRERCNDRLDHILQDPDIEFGIVSSWTTETVFCRFWSKQYTGAMRTMANSEGCNRRDLELYSSQTQATVDNWLMVFRAHPDKYGWHEQSERA